MTVGRTLVAATALAAAVLGLCARPAVTSAQTPPEPDYDHMRGRLFVEGDQEGDLSRVPSALRGQALDVASRILALLRRDSGITSPVGYSPVMWRIVNPPRLDDAPVAVTYAVNGVLLFGASLVDGKGEGPVAAVYVNRAEAGGCIISSPIPAAPRDERGPIFAMAPILATVRGHPHFADAFHRDDSHDSCILIARSDRPLFIPVAKGEYLRAALAQARLDSAHWFADARRQLANTKQPPASIAADTGLLAAMEKQRPGSSEQLRKNLADGAKLAAQLNAGLRQTAERAVADSLTTQVVKNPGVIARLLAAIPAAERREPAYLTLGENDSVTASTGLEIHFGNRTDPVARAVVRYNPAYFASSASPTQPQFITIFLGWGGLPTQGVGTIRREAYQHVLDGLDWAALEALIKP